MSRAVRRTYRLDGRVLEAVLRAADGRVSGTLTAGDDTTDVDVAAARLGATEIRLDLGDRSVRAHVVRDGETAWVAIDGRTYAVTLEEPGARPIPVESAGDVLSNPKGTIRIPVEP